MGEIPKVNKCDPHLSNDTQLNLHKEAYIHTYVEIKENNKFGSQLECFLCQHKLFILAFKGVSDSSSWVTLTSKRLGIMMNLTVIWDALEKWELDDR